VSVSVCESIAEPGARSAIETEAAYKVRLLLPHYRLGSAHLMPTAAYAATFRDDVDLAMAKFGSSLLAKGFNILWSGALNAAARGECTHACMMHDDVVPEEGWLDKLIAVMEARGDPLVSVVSPIKDPRGLTSSGIAYPGNRWEVRRFTLHECVNILPETWGTKETIAVGLNPGGWPVVFNTGLWLADLRDPRWQETDKNGVAKYYFTITDQMYFDKQRGEFCTRGESEDWFFSREVAAGGIPYCCTRAVRLKHLGEYFYANDQVHGQEKDDRFFDYGPNDTIDPNQREQFDASEVHQGSDTIPTRDDHRRAGRASQPVIETGVCGGGDGGADEETIGRRMCNVIATPTEKRIVRGWITTEECATLRKLAAGKQVLEVGTFCGLSALTMAQDAAKVFCLDHFCGDTFTGPANVRDEFLGNVDAVEGWDKIIPLIGSQEVVLPSLDLSHFDLIFYDADHTYESTARGIKLLAGAVNAVIVFHDYSLPHEGVMAAVNEFVRDTGRNICVVHSLAITTPRSKA